MQVGFARVIWAEYIAPILLLTAFLHQSRVECGRFGLLRRFTHPVSNPVIEFALVSNPPRALRLPCAALYRWQTTSCQSATRAEAWYG